MRFRPTTKLTSFLASALLVGAMGCGGDGGGPSGPSPSYESIAGSYAGVLTGSSQGIALNANFSLTINQSSGSLSGTYGISGTLNNGVSSVDVAGTGTLTGGIAAGNNPSVNITVRSGACPNYTAAFSGAYDSVNQRITITGPVEFFDTCNAVLLTYQSTIILNR